jgi:hypothetical protein
MKHKPANKKKRAHFFPTPPSYKPSKNTFPVVDKKKKKKKKKLSKYRVG